MDTALYRDKIAYYWGVYPFEQYGSTEEGPIATQTWTKKDMIFFPDACFLEFIPEEEWAHNRRDPEYMPRTILLNEVEVNRKYELVITSFYGKTLMRYRTSDMVIFTDMEEHDSGIKLPTWTFVARTDDLIDLAGFAGLIDEKMVWQAIIKSGIEYNEWAIRKETVQGEPVLHLYIEPKKSISVEEIRSRVQESMKAINPFYADYEAMIRKQPLEVSLLAKGTFQAYMLAKQNGGSDLAHLKPAHMNASEEVIELLLELSEQQH
jgi:phenylacetate-coenzyme A ligase PaaK-like adenylate-forming protein